jgi:hypothetical protein
MKVRERTPEVFLTEKHGMRASYRAAGVDEECRSVCRESAS